LLERLVFTQAPKCAAAKTPRAQPAEHAARVHSSSRVPLDVQP
jgi:hypothetical protein